ncbi:MAG TPA: NAD-dependent epimerase/dehydratase family protein [Candidatus Paceibacterota bacterium]|nr:NAD-dependent epimerase/dehydratase family protein [Candidatus Paceibacterota bacterium]
MNREEKIAVVTGGAGFIGSHLTEELLARGYSVRVVDSLVAGKREHVPTSASFFRSDIRDRDVLTSIFAGAQYVFHLAALPRVEYAIQHPIETHDVNVTGTLTVLDAARTAGVDRVVLASSAAIYGDNEEAPLHEELRPIPVSPYGAHKYIGERYLSLFSRLYGLGTVSLRFFNVYGPRLDPNGPYALVVGRFLKLRKGKKPLTITGDGKQTRDFVHVRDIVRALIAAAESGDVGKGEVINIGTGYGTSVNELAGFFGGEHVYVPARIEPRVSYADIRKAKKLLGWEPTVSLKDGIAELKREWGIV